MRVEGQGVDGRGDVKVSSKHHPFVGDDASVSETADVVPLGVLVSLPVGVLVALDVDFKAKGFHFLNQVLRSIFVGGVALSGPAVEEAFCAVGQVGWVKVLVRQEGERVVGVAAVDESCGVPRTLAFLVGRRSQAFDGSRHGR